MCTFDSHKNNSIYKDIVRKKKLFESLFNPHHIIMSSKISLGKLTMPLWNFDNFFILNPRKSLFIYKLKYLCVLQSCSIPLLFYTSNMFQEHLCQLIRGCRKKGKIRKLRETAMRQKKIKL